MNFENRVCLIVGASSGMGRVVASRLGAAGAKLVVTARRADKLEALASEISKRGGSVWLWPQMRWMKAQRSASCSPP